MRWFKHMTASSDDEKLSRLIDACGLEGYGFWWRVLEIVAAQVDKDNEPSVSYSVSKWCSLLGIHHHKFHKLIRICAECGLYEIEEIMNSTSPLPRGYPDATSPLPQSYPDSNHGVTAKYGVSSYKVKIYNLLKYRDEYTKKSGQTPDKLRSKKQIQIQIQNKEKSKQVSKGATRSGNMPSYDEMVDAYTRNQDLRQALGEFIVMRKAAKKPFTNAALEHTFRELDKLAGAEDAAKIAILNQSVQRGWQGVFPVKDPLATPQQAGKTGMGLHGNTANGVSEQNKEIAAAVLARRQARQATRQGTQNENYW
ncbi:MAG: DUF4373 domain-containing protein [Desulfovibrio sp.]|jgi:hypothetical protein|nr:DUF4373 domain-containing protein [Desulfovibrio sp.]